MKRRKRAGRRLWEHGVRMTKVTILLFVGVLGCSKSESEPPKTDQPSATKAPPKTDQPTTKPDQPTATKAAKDPAAARALIASGATVIDVRTADEFAEGHVAKAVNMPVQDLPAHLADVDKLVAGDRSRPVVVYCASGHRAATAKTDLEAAGYSHVVNGGGYDDLQGR